MCYYGRAMLNINTDTQIIMVWCSLGLIDVVNTIKEKSVYAQFIMGAVHLILFSAHLSFQSIVLHPQSEKAFGGRGPKVEGQDPHTPVYNFQESYSNKQDGRVALIDTLSTRHAETSQ